MLLDLTRVTASGVAIKTGWSSIVTVEDFAGGTGIVMVGVRATDHPCLVTLVVSTQIPDRPSLLKLAEKIIDINQRATPI